MAAVDARGQTDAIEENVYAGTAMSRRAGYMYGAALARVRGQVSAAWGRPRTHTVDGVEIEFQMAPGTEAPAEMHSYFPRYRALCMAELTHRNGVLVSPNDRPTTRQMRP